MARKALKEATRGSAAARGGDQVTEVVTAVIDDIRARGDAAVREYSAKFDNWSPDSFRLSDNEIKRIVDTVPAQGIEDIEVVQANVRRFAQAQKDSLHEIEVETSPGVRLGHKHVPVGAAGAYVPGGR
jgi:sulfopropanediol 3-dehydrogenase